MTTILSSSSAKSGSGRVRDLVRDEVMLSATTCVVKVGSNVLTGPDGRLDPARIAHLAEEIGALWKQGRKIALVSSGAVAAGMGQLGLSKRPDNLRQVQAAAAVGQAHLIRAYDECFRARGMHAAQLLLNHSDFDSRERYLNIRNTVTALMEWNAVPVINENDSVSVDEIKFGDNDKLAAMVANAIQAPLLVILSVVDGLYASDPTVEIRDEITGVTEAPRPIALVPKLDRSVFGLASDGTSRSGTGGMKSKLLAVKLVTQAGGSVIVAAGKRQNPLTSLFQGEPFGTLFLAQGQSQAARRRWIGFTARPKGRFTIDAGARRALEIDHKSLLAIGIKDIQGDFEKGDVIAVHDAAGEEFARGLSSYGADDARKIQGLRSDKARELLGNAIDDEVIHRDNLVLIV